jgi:hypothetical protein
VRTWYMTCVGFRSQHVNGQSMAYGRDVDGQTGPIVTTVTAGE